MFTKQQIMDSLQTFSFAVGRPVLVHSSLRAVGEVEGRGEGLLDCLISFFTQRGGLLCIPTHTWDFDEMNMVTGRVCIGTLPYLAATDTRALRTLHPTHSMAIYGERDRAEAFAAEEVFAETPAPPNGCYGKLCAQDGNILLLGVGHNRNTYLHSVEEMLQVPNRLSREKRNIRMIYADGREELRQIYSHCAEGIGDVSARYPKYEAAFRYHECITDGMIGNGIAQMCRARAMYEVLVRIYQRSGGRELMYDDAPIPRALYELS